MATDYYENVSTAVEDRIRRSGYTTYRTTWCLAPRHPYTPDEFWGVEHRWRRRACSNELAQHGEESVIEELTEHLVWDTLVHMCDIGASACRLQIWTEMSEKNFECRCGNPHEDAGKIVEVIGIAHPANEELPLGTDFIDLHLEP